MKTLNSTKKPLVMLFAFLILSCGAETVLATIFIASFAGHWEEVGNVAHTISLNQDNSTVESGNFTGEEVLNGVESKISGAYKGLTITNFTIKRSANNPTTPDAKYTGTMVPISETVHTIKEINLKSPDDPDNLYLVMQKN